MNMKREILMNKKILEMKIIDKQFNVNPAM